MDNKTSDLESSYRDTIILLKSRTRRLVIYIGIMIVLNFLMSILITNGGARHLTGEVAG